MSAQEWNGKSYDRISGPQESMGLAVLDRLELRGDEVVLDAGCGSGRITEALLQRLPHGRVVAVDASPSMADAARERLGAAAAPGGQVEIRVLDLLDLDLSEPVDAVLSTATFHWVGDHDRLFRRLRTALRAGGKLAAQCGGEGNIDVLRGKVGPLLERHPYAEHFRGWTPPWNYQPADVTEARLLDAGFAAARCWLAPAPNEPEHAREFLATIILGPHTRQLPAELRERFVDDAMAAIGAPVIVDYVRLNIDATA
jgi:trans-aconitate 2-methyltransferase